MTADDIWITLTLIAFFGLPAWIIYRWFFKPQAPVVPSTASDAAHRDSPVTASYRLRGQGMAVAVMEFIVSLVGLVVTTGVPVLIELILLVLEFGISRRCAELTPNHQPGLRWRSC
jgi:hypothetical protein